MITTQPSPSLQRTLFQSILAIGFFLFCAFAAVAVMQRSPTLTVAAFAIAVSLMLMLRWPEAGTLATMFILYSNLAVALVHSQAGSNLAGAAMDTGFKGVLLGSVGLVLVVPLFYYLIIRRENLIADRTLALMLLFLCAMTLSAFFAHDQVLASQQILDYLLEGVALYVLVVNVVRDWSVLRHVLWALLLAGALMSGLSVFQEVTHTNKNDYWGLAQRGGVFATNASGNEVEVRTRAAGPIGEQNRYGQILLVLLPFAVYFFRHERSRVLRGTALLFGFLICGGIILTFSRGIFLAVVILAIAMAVVGFLSKRQLAVAAVIASLLIVVAEPDYVTRLASLTRVTTLASTADRPDADQSSARRFAGNIASLKAFGQNPVLGVGPGNYARYYSTKFVNELGLAQQSRNFRGHNLYLEMAADNGIIGLGCFLLIVFSLMVWLRRAARGLRSHLPEMSDLASAFWLSFLAYLASGVFEHLAYPRYFWLLVALASATLHVVRLEVARRTERSYVRVGATRS